MSGRLSKHELWELCAQVARAGLATKLLPVHIPECEAAFQGLSAIVQHLRTTSSGNICTSVAFATIILHGVRGKDGVAWCTKELIGFCLFTGFPVS